MDSKFQLNLDLRRHNLGKPLFLFWCFVYVLVIVQDYVFSILRHTGFYWSEVLLFNGYWLLFIPLSLLGGKLIKSASLHSKSNGLKILFWSVFVFLFSVIHLLVFTSLITVISNFYFNPPHLFIHTLVASISKDMYLTVLVYFFVPFLFKHLEKEKAVEKFNKNFIVKKDNKLLSIDVLTIYCFSTDKPYTSLHTKDRTYLLNQSLKDVEQSLDPEIFLRVHRSTIVNKHFIKTIISRKNGDYDVVLKNNNTLRLSRHYRKNWNQLISPPLS